MTGPTTQPISRAIDGDGLPLVVHHGTCRKPFESFDRMAGTMSRKLDTIDKVGIWFSTSRDDAARFAGSQGEAHVVSATIEVRNPLVVQGFAGLAEFGRRHGLTRTDKMSCPINRHLPGEAFREKLIELGHDGIRMIGGGSDDFRDSNSDYWVVLDDRQIVRLPSPEAEEEIAPAFGGPR